MLNAPCNKACTTVVMWPYEAEKGCETMVKQERDKENSPAARAGWPAVLKAGLA